jgi:hypothetical protein
MATCPVCGYDNLFGALVCVKCSALLTRQPPDQPTTTLPQSEPPRPEHKPPSERQATRELGPLAADEVALYVGQSDKPLLVQIASQAVLGRHAAGSASQPRIDLASYDAFGKGVSRMHAIIRRTDKGLVVEDLASSNGSWLNGVRLTPFLPHPLRAGDLLKLSQLEIVVYF